MVIDDPLYAAPPGARRDAMSPVQAWQYKGWRLNEVYAIEEMTVKAAPEQIVHAYENTIKGDDVFGEYFSCLLYLPFEHAKPYLRDGVTEKDWEPDGDKELREQFEHYRDWWREKIINERGISVHRGKAQFAIRMMIAGLPEWRTLWDMDGGWYQRGAWNYVADLFGFEKL
jgi:hypothetical protein